MDEGVMLIVDYMNEDCEIKRTVLMGSSQADALKNLIESGLPFEVKHVGKVFSLEL